MKKEIKKIIIDKADNKNVELRNEDEEVEFIEEYFDKLRKDVEIFDEDAWNSKAGFSTPNFPSFTKGLEGWSPGFYVWAGSANHGKSAIMLNILEDLCMCEENKLFGIYYSLDDSKNRIIPRIIAMRECIPISIVSKPLRYQNMIEEGVSNAADLQELLDKRAQGIENLKNDSNKMTVFESQEVEFIEDIYDKTDKIYNYIKTEDPDANIVIAIDSLKDIMINNAVKMTANERIDIVAKKIKDLSKKYNCIVFASMHLRKLNGNRRPTMDDIKDSNTLEYEGDVFFLINNDVSKNKQGAKIFYRESNESIEKKPVIEVDWGKNKLSSYKGITFCNFSPEYSKCIEVDEESAKKYSAIVYQL